MRTAQPEAKLSKNHRLVQEILNEQGHGTHLAISDLYEIARARRPGIGFTTVYRAVTRLRDLGLIDEILIPGADRAIYERAGAKHAHFRCTACGAVHDVEYALPSGVTEALAAQFGGRVTGANVSLQGLCAACSSPDR
jgi:Fe2+ or Zn2+ uptake regulation protein